MALVNAIYLKGQWKCPFNPDIKRTAMFQVSSDEEGPVKMMIQTARFRYSLNRRLDCQILELPYCGDRLAMYILLPTRTGGLASLERKLIFNSVNSALTKLRRRRLSVAVPVFEMKVDKNFHGVFEGDGNETCFHSRRRLQCHQFLTVYNRCYPQGVHWSGRQRHRSCGSNCCINGTWNTNSSLRSGLRSRSSVRIPDSRQQDRVYLVPRAFRATPATRIRIVTDVS